MSDRLLVAPVVGSDRGAVLAEALDNGIATVYQDLAVVPLMPA
jgi:ABC-type sugar transport system ATPase subunit